MAEIILFSEIVEENGKTIRENNMERQHTYPLGSLVEVDVRQHRSGNYGNDDEAKVDLSGKCKLYVVAHTRDCDGTPLYVLSDLEVEYPINPSGMLPEGARIKQLHERMKYKYFACHVELNRSEESLKPTGKSRKLYESIADMFS